MLDELKISEHHSFNNQRNSSIILNLRDKYKIRERSHANPRQG